MSELSVFKYGADYCWWKLHKSIPTLFRRLKWGWQRAVKGYCDCDLFSLDEYYLELFSETLEELANTTHGWPDKDFKTYDDWIYFLKKMSRKFKEAQLFSDESFSIELKEIKEKRQLQDKALEDGFTMMKAHFRSLWD